MRHSRGRGELDLCYAEDSAAEVDMNVVMTGSGNFVEVQGTAEGQPFAKGYARKAAEPCRRRDQEACFDAKEHLGRENQIGF